MFNEFNPGKRISLTYDFQHNFLNQIRRQYKLDEIAGYGTDFEKATNLLSWVSDPIYHNGSSDAYDKNVLELLEYSYDRGIEHGLNCAMLSHVLSACLMSIHLYCRIMNPIHEEC